MANDNKRRTSSRKTLKREARKEEQKAEKVYAEDSEKQFMHDKADTAKHREQQKPKIEKRDRLKEAALKNEKKIENLQLRYAQTEDDRKRRAIKQEIWSAKRENEEILNIPFYERETNNLFMRAVSAIVRKVMYVVSPTYRAAVQYGIHNAYKEAFMEDKEKPTNEKETKESSVKETQDKKKQAEQTQTPQQHTKGQEQAIDPADPMMPENPYDPEFLGLDNGATPIPTVPMITKLQEDRAMDDCQDHYVTLPQSEKDHVDSELLTDWYTNRVSAAEANEMTSFSFHAAKDLFLYSIEKAEADLKAVDSNKTLRKEERLETLAKLCRTMKEQVPNIYQNQAIQECIGAVAYLDPSFLGYFIKETGEPSKETMDAITEGIAKEAKEIYESQHDTQDLESFFSAKTNEIKDKAVSYLKESIGTENQPLAEKAVALITPSISVKGDKVVIDEDRFSSDKAALIQKVTEEIEKEPKQEIPQTPEQPKTSSDIILEQYASETNMKPHSLQDSLEQPDIPEPAPEPTPSDTSQEIPLENLDDAISTTGMPPLVGGEHTQDRDNGERS